MWLSLAIRTRLTETRVRRRRHVAGAFDPADVEQIKALAAGLEANRQPGAARSRDCGRGEQKYADARPKASTLDNGRLLGWATRRGRRRRRAWPVEIVIWFAPRTVAPTDAHSDDEVREAGSRVCANDPCGLFRLRRSDARSRWTSLNENHFCSCSKRHGKKQG